MRVYVTVSTTDNNNAYEGKERSQLIGNDL